MAPIDTRLVEPALLTGEEIAWLNAYHSRVRDTLAPLVDAPTREWLIAATAPLEWAMRHAQRMSFAHSSSLKTLTPCFFASASLEPAPGPATT